MKNQKIILILLLILISGNVSLVLASEPNPEAIEKCTRFQVGYLGTNYRYNGKLVYNSGFQVQHTYCLKLNKNTGLGIGAGFFKYEQQTMLPVYIDFMRCIRNSLIFEIQTGYSIGWKRNSEYFEGYSLNGGLYGGTGIGYRFRLNEIFSSYILCSYKYQGVNLKSETNSAKKLNFNSFAISIGIMLEKE